MKNFQFFALLIISVFIVSCAKKEAISSKENDLISLIKEKTKKLDAYYFSPDFADTIDVKRLFLADSALYYKLDSIELTDIDSLFFYRYFELPEKRIGLITLLKTWECDSRFSDIELFILDSNASLIAKKPLTYDGSDFYPFVYRGEFGKDFQTLKSSWIHYEESIEENDKRRKDTLYTEITTINLVSKKIDTIKFEKSFILVNPNDTIYPGL